MSAREERLGASQEPSEEQLRAAYEAELARITTTDMMAQATVSLLNLGARRLPTAAAGEHPAGGAQGDAPGSEGVAGAQGAAATGADLEQVRDAIDAARALLAILERRIPRELAPLRDALSQLQLAYARAASAAPTASAAQPQGEAADAAQREQPPGAGEQQATDKTRGPGPAESSGRLWVPGR